MLYIQQSLNPNEEIIKVGHFHWWYTFNAMMWLVIGVAMMTGILYAAYYWEVMQFVKSNYPNVPDNLYDRAWNEAVEQKGGFMNVFLSSHIAVKLSAFAVFVVCVLIFAQKMVIKSTTEICLTTERLVLKRGVIARHIEEISVDRIEGVDVFQGILGRILGFGRINVRGMGVGEIDLPLIAQPVDFKKAIDRSRSMRRSGNNF